MLSETRIAVNLPANFLTMAEGLSSEAIVCLLAFFQLVSRQEAEADLVLAYDLKLSLPENFQDDLLFKRAMTELQQADLLFEVSHPELPQKKYLIAGTEKGKQSYQQILQNPSLISENRLAKALPEAERPNIFKLYEENFGVLTPMIAETLQADLESYSFEWLEDAMKEAIEHNARNWKYVQAILRNWQEKGHKRAHEDNKRDIDEFRKLYLDQKNKRK
jgi:DnaD/phage-associated family protein